LAQQPNLMAALEQVSTEVGVPMHELVKSVEQGLAAAYRRAFDPPGYITVRLNPATAAIEVTSRETLEDGSERFTRLPTEDFARMAAQAARQAVMRHIRDLERDRAMTEVGQRRGELASGVVDRLDRGVVFVDLGGVEGWMPPDEQIPGEEMVPGRPVTVVILEAKPSQRQAQVRVSRSSKSFVLRLLEAEVPEVAAGTVIVRAIAREPGVRTKLAVSSRDPSVDARGACIGPKGVRHRSLLAELGGEHVDIVAYDDDPGRFVASALGPATVLGVQLDEETRTAHVEVPKDQLSLAIGKDGQNARLAAKLTGWRIDIRAGDAESQP